MQTIRSESEINKQIDLASESIENGGSYGFLTYEDGVKEALLWVTHNNVSAPMEDE